MYTAKGHVAPGIIKTDMITHLNTSIIERLKSDTPLVIFGTPRNIAELVLFLAKSTADFITGQIISPNGGFVV